MLGCGDTLLRRWLQGDPETPGMGLWAPLGAACVCTFPGQDDQQVTDTHGLAKLTRSDCFAH